MKIGVIGAGNMADALATQWVRAGHEVLITGRTEEKARQLAQRIGPGAQAGSLAQAAAFGDVVLLAVRREGVVQVLSEAHGADRCLDGKVVIDCTNPIAEAEDFRLVTADGPSIARQLAEAAPGSRIVKAFNVCNSAIWELTPPAFDGRPLGVPLAGDDREAREIVAALVQDIGAAPVEVGGLDRADQIEALAAIVIRLLVLGEDVHAVLPPSQPAPEQVLA